MTHLEATALILTSLVFYATTVIIVIAALRTHYKKRELISKEILTAIEKGADIPLPTPRERNYRNQGVIWLLLGIALFIALWVTLQELTAAIWGLLPVALGVSLLLIHQFQQKDERIQS
ncbi:MAG: DUF6249 domain-containing protein [Pirellulales bacterium]|nr:DUF6249 domain-containing protein [Pirellulales bacterium]